MDELAAFLKARLDEEQFAATLFRRDAEWSAETLATIWGRSPDDPIIRHAAYYDPARVLREVEAKREILTAYIKIEAGGIRDSGWIALRFAVETLAGAYRDHPDYRPEWKPA